MRGRRFICSAAVFLLSLRASHAAGLQLPTFIASHMALQRAPHSAQLWGWADPGTSVSVLLDATTLASVEPAADGTWTVELPPQAAGWDHTITVTDGTISIELTDIVFGDVYICGGQSNMELSVNAAFNASNELAAASQYTNIRLATPDLIAASSPQLDVPSKADYAWARSSSEAMVTWSEERLTKFARSSWFSATCYFFGRSMYTALDGQVPIGLVSVAYGGRKIECFSSVAALADGASQGSCGGTRAGSSMAEGSSILQTAEEAAGAVTATEEEEAAEEASSCRIDESALVGDSSARSGSGYLWDGMLAPLLRMRFTGAVWYQGESNSAEAPEYACLFPAMVADWRSQFGLPALAFVYVQLAPLVQDFTRAAIMYHQSLAFIRAAQDVALQLPYVGVAVTIDLGDPDSPWGAHHPRRKQEVHQQSTLRKHASRARPHRHLDPPPCNPQPALSRTPHAAGACLRQPGDTHVYRARSPPLPPPLCILSVAPEDYQSTYL